MKDSLQDVLSFWFEEISPAQWFHVNEAFDQMIRSRFGALYTMAMNGVYDDWGRTVDGSLALGLVLDQFPRNMIRDTPAAFGSDAKALEVERRAIGLGYDHVVAVHKRRFLYLPFEHSEILADQLTSLELFETMREDDPLSYDYALRHYKLIERFGRFPHRNAILVRASTPDELAFLSEHGRGF